MFHVLAGSGRVIFQRLHFRHLLRRARVNPRIGDAILAAAGWHAAFRHVIKKREQRVVVALRDRIVFVIVALRARHRQAHPCRRRRVHAVEKIVPALLLRDRAALAVQQMIAIESGRDELIARRIRQQIAGELFDRKLVERHVRIQRTHHPIAPHPLKRIAVLLKAIAVRKPRRVEPRQRHPFAIVRRGEQTVGQMADGGWRMAE